MSSCTSELAQQVAARVELGVSFAEAVTAAGVKLPTAKTWLARGRREDVGCYATFAEVVDAARERAQERPEPMGRDELLARVSQMVRGGSVEAAKLLDRMLDDEGDDDDLGF